MIAMSSTMLWRCGDILLRQSYLGKKSVKAIEGDRYKPVIWKGISTEIQKVYAEKAAATMKEKKYMLDKLNWIMTKNGKDNTFGAKTSIDLRVSSRRKADVSANPVAT